MDQPKKPDALAAHRQLLAPAEVDTVIYHGNCRDGFGAAWAAHKALSVRSSGMLGSVSHLAQKQPTFIPAAHSDRNEPPDVTGRNVLIVDFAYSLPATKRMIQQAKKLVILDHHKTSMLELKGLTNAFFDLNKSGARLAWEFFHPEKPAPQLVEYIEDRDLWRWQVPRSKEFSAGFYALPMTFDTFNGLAERPEVMQQTIEKGATIVEMIDTLVKRAARRAVRRKWMGYTVQVVNSSFWQSEVGNELAQTADIGLVWLQNGQNVLEISLRSARDDVDVSVVAQHFGGGGHPRASGFLWKGDIESLLNVKP